MLRAIVFDFDGVIANSEPLHLRAFQDVLAELQVPLAEADYYARYLGYDDVGVFRAVSAERQLQWPADQVTALVSRKAVRMEALDRGIRQEIIDRVCAIIRFAVAHGREIAARLGPPAAPAADDATLSLEDEVA